MVGNLILGQTSGVHGNLLGKRLSGYFVSSSVLNGLGQSPSMIPRKTMASPIKTVDRNLIQD